MRYLSLLVVLVFPLIAWGQDHENKNGKSNLPQDASYSKITDSDNNAYASATLGNGFAYGKGIVSGRSMEGRTFEFRFGKEISVPAFLAEKLNLQEEKFRLDLIHFNEGHPKNNHRDGFSTQMVYRKPVNQKLNLELGLGPYFSTHINSRNPLDF